MPNYIMAMTRTHRLLVGTIILMFLATLLFGRVNYFGIANAEVLLLTQMDQAPLSLALSRYLEGTLRSKLSAAAQAKVGMGGSDVAIWISQEPLDFKLPVGDDLSYHHTISRLLAAYFPEQHLNFETATLQQIHDALGIYIYVPDITGDAYVRELEQCTRKSEFKPERSWRGIHIKVMHGSPVDDLEIPGSHEGRAVVLLPTVNGPTECFSVNRFTLHTAREVLTAMWTSGRYPDLLPLFQELVIPHPSLDLYPWGALKDLTVSQAQAELRRMASFEDRMPALGTSLPLELLPVLLPLCVIVVQLVLLGHLRAALSNARGASSATNEWAWIGIYPDVTSRVITLASTTLLPVVATAFLWDTAYVRPFSLSFPSAYRICALLIMTVIGLSIESSLTRLRNS